MDMTTFWTSNNELEWNCGLTHYWNILKPGLQTNLENEINVLDADMVKKMSVEEFLVFLRDKYYVWKYTAPNRLATTRKSLAKTGLNDLARIHHDLFTFNHDDIVSGLKVAMRIGGLGPSGASGLLAILFPKDFGTVDQFVVKALQSAKNLPEHNAIMQINPYRITLPESELLIRLFRKKSSELNRVNNANIWTPRKIDMVLWAFGRTPRGKDKKNFKNRHS